MEQFTEDLTKSNKAQREIFKGRKKITILVIQLSSDEDE